MAKITIRITVIPYRNAKLSYFVLNVRTIDERLSWGVMASNCECFLVAKPMRDNEQSANKPASPTPNCGRCFARGRSLARAAVNVGPAQ
jgi:hypothetical protein